MKQSNFINFVKMQFFSLSQIVWLQLLCIVLYPMFFSRINEGYDNANTTIYAAGLIMLSYLIIRNFGFNDAKYKTRLLFSILPVTSKVIIGARGAIIYLFCLIATPLVVLFSNVFHLIKPDIFAAIPLHILPAGFLLAAVFLPIEFLIFYMFETQKADIIAALAAFPYMGLILLMYKYLMNGPLWNVVLIIAIITNMVCFKASEKLYQSRQI